MTKNGLALCGAILALGLTGCSSHDQEKAKSEIQREAKLEAAEARKAGSEIKADANELRRNVNAAVKPDGESASSKVSNGIDKVEDATARAGAKLNQAALLAQVKTQLASQAGLSTMGTIDVSVKGSEVTLAGSVSSAEDKQTAERVAGQVEGVTHVRNRLVVKP